MYAILPLISGLDVKAWLGSCKHELPAELAVTRILHSLTSWTAGQSQQK